MIWTAITHRTISLMRLSPDALSTKVVVRRAGRGTARFVWEITHDNNDEPLYISPEAFASMEAAYQAGQARLIEFMPSRRSMPAAVRHY